MVQKFKRQNATHIILSLTLTCLVLQACSCNQNDKWEDANIDSDLECESCLDEFEKMSKAWEEEFEKQAKALEEEFEKQAKACEEEFEKQAKALEEEYGECWDEDAIDEDVNISREEYKQILEFYRENYDNLSQEEKEILNKKIGQYNGQIVKDEIERAEEAVKKTGERIPSIVKGFISVFKK